MLFLIVLPVMSAASYWSKREDKKYQENIMQKDVQKEESSIETVTKSATKSNKELTYSIDKTSVKPLHIIHELSKINPVAHVFAKEQKRINNLAAHQKKREFKNNFLGYPRSLYEAFKHNEIFMVGSRLAWITGVAFRNILNYRPKRFKPKYKPTNSTAVTLWKPKESVMSSSNTLNVPITTSLRNSKPRDRNKCISKTNLVLAKVQIVENSLNSAMIDSALVSYVIQQRLDDLMWMGLYYSMTLANSNFNKVACAG